MGSKHILTGILLGVLATLAASGQQVTAEGPVHERELITLTQDTPFDQALRVIQTFAGQVVVDPQRLTVPIGANIDRQPWRQALDKIAAINSLRVVNQGNYLELYPVAAADRSQVDEHSRVSVDSREVSITAIFFQADRLALRELGVDWSTLSGGRVDIRASSLGANKVTSDQVIVGARTNINRSLSIDILVKTFESENTGEVMARPQIKVRSGKSGYIQVGTDFSVTTADFAGNAITKFFSTGTILTVKPVLLSEDGIDFVDLNVEAERSAVVDPVRNLISKTVARTSTLLRDGEQTAIGGLYGQEVSVSRSGVPLFRNLPAWLLGLRYVFGHDSRLVSNTELVIMLKVDIVPSVRQRARQQLQEKVNQVPENPE
jgi:general secretion pathway protein D